MKSWLGVAIGTFALGAVFVICSLWHGQKLESVTMDLDAKKLNLEFAKSTITDLTRIIECSNGAKCE